MSALFCFCHACREILHHSPDIVCLQEVDRFPEFQHALQPHGCVMGFYVWHSSRICRAGTRAENDWSACRLHVQL